MRKIPTSIDNSSQLCLQGLKGVVDKTFDVVETLNAHFRTQGGRLPKKISKFHLTVDFCENEKILYLRAKFFAKLQPGESLRPLDYYG